MAAVGENRGGGGGGGVMGIYFKIARESHRQAKIHRQIKVQINGD